MKKKISAEEELHNSKGSLETVLGDSYTEKASSDTKDAGKNDAKNTTAKLQT